MLDTPQKRLEHYIKKVFGTKVAFAKAMDIMPTSVTKYAGSKAKSIFGTEYQAKLDALGLNIAWYLTGKGQMIEDSNQSSTTLLPNVDNLTIAEMREILTWYEQNIGTIKKLLDSIDK